MCIICLWTLFFPSQTCQEFERSGYFFAPHQSTKTKQSSTAIFNAKKQINLLFTSSNVYCHHCHQWSTTSTSAIFVLQNSGLQNMCLNDSTTRVHNDNAKPNEGKITSIVIKGLQSTASPAAWKSKTCYFYWVLFSAFFLLLMLLLLLLLLRRHWSCCCCAHLREKTPHSVTLLSWLQRLQRRSAGERGPNTKRLKIVVTGVWI